MNNYFTNRSQKGWWHKAKRILKERSYRFSALDQLGFYNHMPDKIYLEKKFNALMGYNLLLDMPKTFNEKLQWLKLYDRKPEYTIMVDKYAVRSYIADRLGEEYLIPLLGVWEEPFEIDFTKLPDRFVLKCNHNSGLGMCICRDKSKLNLKNVKKKLIKGIKQDYYLTGREWPYKNVPRRIIAEQYMEDTDLKELRDYKFFCFNGKVKCFKVDFGRFIEHHANYYDLENNMLPFGEIGCPPRLDVNIQIPKSINKMIKLAEILSREIPFLRVDFYDIDGRIYFGEMTFFPDSGFGKFTDENWDRMFGTWIRLPGRDSGE